MPDTGAPWNIPYVAGTDLVADWPTDNQTMAEAIADALDLASKLVAIETVAKDDTFSASVTAGADTLVTGLSITHTLAAATNKLLILATFGVAASSSGYASIGLAPAVDGTLINLGQTAGSRVSTSSSYHNETGATTNVTNLSVQVVYTPGDTSSHTYAAHAVNVSSSTRTLYVNRSAQDVSSGDRPRGASNLTIIEFKP